MAAHGLIPEMERLTLEGALPIMAPSLQEQGLILLAQTAKLFRELSHYSLMFCFSLRTYFSDQFWNSNYWNRRYFKW
jgi:hypothetical protein